MYAQIVVNLPVEGTYHYHIPAELAGYLQVGHLVEVSFGQQKAQGVILSIDRRSPVTDTKPVERLVERTPVVSDTQLALARWLSITYLAPLSECVRLFIPPGLSRRGDVLITPAIPPEQIEATSQTQALLLGLLARRGPLRGRQIARSLPRRDWQKAVSQLVERGLLLREPVLDPPAVQPKQARIAELAFPPEQVETIIARQFEHESTSPRDHVTASRRAAVLRALARERRPLEVKRLYAAVAGATLADLKALAEDDLLVLRRQEVWRDPLEGEIFVPDTPPPLTPDQATAWEVIHSALDGQQSPRPILLHGVTGSGKTELYLRAVAHVLERGHSAIVLVPEIALTPQTIHRFGARFPGRMGLIHSALSTGERYDTWRRAHSGQLSLIVGPRSALFAPLPRLGLIILDECHDDSYKQSPPVPPPYYHALPTAIELARLQGALVIMGSATPDITTYARAVPYGSSERGDFTLLELPARILGHRHAIEVQALRHRVKQTRYSHLPGNPDETVMIDLPPVQVVDMRQELRANNRSIFSRALTAALEETLAHDEQAILFLNRRGTSTYVFCRACGAVFTCPRCEIPMTWHVYTSPHGEHKGILVCHHCNRRTQSPDVCPACGSDQIRFFGAGTERIEQEVRARFPQARPLRWDRDTTGGKDTHATLLQRFINRQANVLIGTQMVAKGLDLPLVTLVGVISADTALYLPDFRSGERTFQLLTQVAGRAGRGLLGGRVIIQTYAPEHYAIQAASRHDYHTFYQQEMARRAEIGYPPYSRLVRLVILAESAERAQQEAKRLYALLSERISARRLVNTSLIGPAPCFYPRHDSLYRWHIIVRGPQPTDIMADLHPSSSLQIDVDPVSLL
jgi:primosomal protein N' (replication factor Y)